MPELPEVETVRRGLEGLIRMKTIQSIRCIDSPKSFPNAADDVKRFVVGASVVAIRRRAKILLVDLTSGYTLVIHLKMTGQLIYVDAAVRWGAGHPNDSFVAALPDRSTRVSIRFSDGSHVYFNDQRKFGWIKLYSTAEVHNIDFMKKVGPEPLEDSFTATAFIERIRKRKNTTIKAALLDQTVVAGIGNIYADESLWYARIHPGRRVHTVHDEELHLLLEGIKLTMHTSIDKGGSTDRNYRDAAGNKGSYLQFANVFRRENQPCPRCHLPIVKIRVAGRGTHICIECQKQK